MPEKPIGQRNYEQFADRYADIAETKPHNAYYERPATLSLLPDVAGLRLRVLDAGCGPGFYAEWLLDHGAEVVAFDVTPRMVERTRQRTGGRAEVHVADLERRLDFAADARFDLVICPLVLDYVADWRPVFAEFYRVLVPGGTLIFSCGHPASEFFVYEPDGNYFDVEQIEMEWRGFGEPHVIITAYRRPLSEVFNPFAEAGFKLDHVLEPRPVEQFKEGDPEYYEMLMRQPGFLCVRARK